VTQDSGSWAGGGVQDVGSNAIFTSGNNRFSENVYNLGQNTTPFAWMNEVLTEVGWSRFGQDVAGTFIR